LHVEMNSMNECSCCKKKRSAHASTIRYNESIDQENELNKLVVYSKTMIDFE